MFTLHFRSQKDLSTIPASFLRDCSRTRECGEFCCSQVNESLGYYDSHN
jgi:hypothetical protein